MNSVEEFDSKNLTPLSLSLSQTFFNRSCSVLSNPFFVYPVKLELSEIGNFIASK